MFSLVLDIATTASILFSVAAGLLVVLGVLKIVNFAHGAFLVIGQLITIGFGREIQFVQTPIAGAITMFGETYSQYRLFLVLAAVVVAGGIGALLNATRLGLEARAVIMNEPLAMALG